MKRLIWSTYLCLSLFAIANAQQPSDAPLTNASVIKLVKAGFKEKTVIAIISNRPNNFKLETEDLITLKHNGVNENIILAMLSSQMGTLVAGDDEWDGDSFFKDLKRPNSGDTQGQGSSIFGSGSSSRSQTRSRGGNGGNENEGNLSGSATVRIVKPAAESGAENASPKLEKTPTLTNEEVIRLVEAGFSEGTIIKRIEQSPVEFDLSPGKLDELFKKRVTDAIITAMRKAMGDK